MLTGRTGRTEHGFSLVELLVAMVITLIVSGAIFQLMSSGETAFRREPEVADRQQAIRVAMDRIWNDVYQAGSGMPDLQTVFDTGLDGIGGMGPLGQATDEIGFVKMGECSPLMVCDSTGASITTRELIDNDCYKLPAVVLLGGKANPPDTQTWGLYWAQLPGGGKSASCASGGG